MSEKQAARLVAAIAAALLTVAIILPVRGFQPYGVAAIQKQISQEDSALCAKLALTDASDPHAADCMAELASLTQRHRSLLAAYSPF